MRTGLFLVFGLITSLSSGFLAAEEPVTSWSLAVPWKAKPIHPLTPATNIEAAYVDAGISAEAQAAVATAFDDSAWTAYRVPGPWEDYGPEWQIDGEAVFRVVVDLPAEIAGKNLELSLGAIDDFDDTFVNGVAVGHIDKSVLGFWTVQRVYQVPGSLVVAGRNVIAVRIFDHFGGGGFTGRKDMLMLRIAPPPTP